MRPTGGIGYKGMGHMGNRAHWAMGTGGMGYRGMEYRGMGHMGNGSHGQWGTWAMGHMGKGAHGLMDNLDIFAYNIIITGWILTKILLDIDINVFYLNTGQFFHDGLN